MVTKALLESTLLEVIEGRVARVQTPDGIIIDFMLGPDGSVRKTKAKRIWGKGGVFTPYFSQARRIAVEALGQNTQHRSWAESCGLLGTEK